MTNQTAAALDMLSPLLDALTERLAPLILAGMAPQQPEADPNETWGTADVCAHLGIATSTLRDRQKLRSFPKRINLGGRPRWLASEIRAYHRGAYIAK